MPLTYTTWPAALFYMAHPNKPFGRGLADYLRYHIQASPGCEEFKTDSRVKKVVNVS